MKSKIKISLILNIIIFVLVLASTIIMFTGFKFMHGYEIVLETTKLGMFKFFTVQSNIFMGISSFIFVIKDIQLLKGNIKQIDKKYYLLKLISTGAVGLTFFIVFAYLGPISKTGISSLLMNSNLFFHLIIPILSFICFIFFENTKEIKAKEVPMGIIPTVVYGIYYLTNILVHMENGIVSPVYDWYWFVQNGVWTAVIVIPIILLITYLINLLLWYMNKKICYNHSR
jgi:hypothetical protein